MRQDEELVIRAHEGSKMRELLTGGRALRDALAMVQERRVFDLSEGSVWSVVRRRRQDEEFVIHAS